MKGYRDFLEDLGTRESGGDYGVVNSLEYLWKYQFGRQALEDVGYWGEGGWTGKDGVFCDGDFLSSPDVQEKAIRKYQKKVWSYIEFYGLDCYVGKKINGVEITPSGLLAGYHLKGIGGSAKSVKDELSDKRKGLRSFLESNGKIDGTDGYGTKILEYIKKFSNYKTPFDKKTEYFIWRS